MKSFVKFTTLAIAFAVAACTGVVDEWDNTPYTPEPVIPEPEDPSVVEFVANVATKTSLDESTGAVSWVAGDEVLFVWEGGSVTAAATTSGSETKFKVKVADGIDKLYAVYPASLKASVSNGQMILEFAKSLEGTTFDKADVSISSSVMAEGQWNTTLNFKKVASLVKVGVVDEAVNSLKVEVPGEALTGKLPVSLDANSNIVFGIPSDTESSITMTIPAPGVYWVPMLPDVNISKGITVALIKGDSSSDTLTSDSELTVLGRGDIIAFSQPEQFTGKYYVSPAGAGSKTGLSVLSPMDVETFMAMVTDPARIEEFNGKVFSFSANNFSFGDDYLIFDYPDYQGEVNIILEGVASENVSTVFNGRTSSESNKAGVLWPKHNAFLTVRNVKFTKTDGKGNSPAIRVASGGKALTVENCVFDGNKTAGNAASIAVYTDAKVLIKDCTFTNNTGNGSAFFVNNADSEVRIENALIKGGKSIVIRAENAKTMEIVDSEISGVSATTIYNSNMGAFTAERVLWKNNHAVDDSGTAAFVEGEGKYIFKDCEFIGNTADWRGGALCFSSSTASLEIVGGKFEGNCTVATDLGSSTSSYGGSAIQLTAPITVDITDVQFLNNYSDLGTKVNAGGVIFPYVDGAVVRCNNCLFDGNYAFRSNTDNTPCPAIAAVRKAVTMYFNGCEFKNNASGTYDGNGSRYGMLMGVHTGSTIAFNNCYLHDNYGGRNADGLDWLYVDNADAKFIVSNSTIIGDPMRKVDATAAPELPTPEGGTPKKGVIHINKDASLHFMNNIMCSPTDGKAIYFAEQTAVESAMYNKTSPVNEYCNWGTDTGSGHDYYANTTCFGGLNGYMWNGTLSGTSSNMLAPTADVNAAIQSADTKFYSWLESVGALGKDIEGNSRGTTSYPGCYKAK